MQQAVGDQLAFGYCDRPFVGRQNNKSRKVEAFGYPEVLEDLASVINKFTVDFQNQPESIVTLLQKLTEFKDAVNIDLTIDAIPENLSVTNPSGIDRIVHKLHLLYMRLLDTSLWEERHTVLVWFEEACEVLSANIGCLSLKLRFPIDGSFNKFFEKLLDGSWNKMVFRHIAKTSKDAVEKYFSERDPQNLHHALETLEKCHSNFTLGISCSETNVGEYLCMKSASIIVALEIRQRKTAAEDVKKSFSYKEILQQTMSTLTIGRPKEYKDLFQLFDQFIPEHFSDMEIEKMRVEKETEGQVGTERRLVMGKLGREVFRSRNWWDGYCDLL